MPPITCRWDQNDTMDFLFTDCVLVRPVGKWGTGQRLAWASIDYDTGTMTLAETEDSEPETFPLTLEIR